MNTMTETKVRLIASPKSWITGEAVRQLYATAKLDGMRLAVGFPDLHPAKGSPVGAAFVSEGVIYPSIIGADIGCGMSLFKTELSRRNAVRMGEWADLHFDLEQPWDGDIRKVLAAWNVEPSRLDNALGTIGEGNHFAELQLVEEVLNAREFRRMGLSKQQFVMLVHSGSRGLGETVLRESENHNSAHGLDAGSFEATTYLEAHDQAVQWAKMNRDLIAHRFGYALGTEVIGVWDGCHNSITPLGDAYIHRRGAVAADNGPVVIPGSCGSFSYLVKPIGDGESHARSLAHGAGRKWARSETRLRIRERFGAEELTQTGMGSRVICAQRELLYEEAPAAYKDIEAVIEDLVDASLVSVVAKFRPLLTYKTRKRLR